MLHTSTGKKQYPPQLLTISQPPKELYIESKNWPDILDRPLLAIVGSRKVSAYGRAVTEQLASAAAARGIVIVSGLALGVDAIAHQAALDTGGQTIAVLPSGLNEIYPSSHTSLARSIVEKGGALVTEYPPHATVAFKGNFIARNRIIAGLAGAVLITEAAEKSGSLHTANFAIEQGKDVLAVPGPITSPLSGGCNNLIKVGATPVTSVDDIFAIFKLTVSAAFDHAATAQNEAELAILDLLSQGVQDIEDLQQQSGLDATTFQQTLSMLEITSRITSVGGGKWLLR